MITWMALASAGSAAGSERVVLIASNDAESEEVVHQVAGELRAAGFKVVTRARDSAPNARELETIARETRSFAAIALWVPEGTFEAEVWVVDLVTGKTVLRRLDDQPEGATRSSIFALKAVELLQASLLELDTGRKPLGEVEASPPVERLVLSARPPERQPRPPIPELPKPSLSWSLLAGGSVTGGPGGIPPTVAPSLGLAWRPHPSWSGQLWFTGPSLVTLGGDEGTATLDQELLLLRVSHQWLAPDPYLGAYVVGGVGAYRLGARGSANPPYESTSAEVWSAAAVIGPGATFSLSEGLRFFVELDAVWLMPQPEIQFAGRRVAVAGHPWFVGTFGVDVRW